jgi:hypothetical protein
LPREVNLTLADSGPVGDVASLLIEAYSAIRAVGHNREELRRKGHMSQAGEDLWSARGLWYFESDYWVRGRVLDLAAYGKATKTQQREVVRQLTAHFKKRQRRRMKQGIDIGDVEQILSLPAWQKRYELYSAWVFTLLLKALEGHVIELEHDKGRISFSFRETLMARVLSAVPPTAIYSERRVPLANPVGHGRLAGAQPDARQMPTCSRMQTLQAFLDAKFRRCFERLQWRAGRRSGSTGELRAYRSSCSCSN